MEVHFLLLILMVGLDGCFLCADGLVCSVCTGKYIYLRVHYTYVVIIYYLLLFQFLTLRVIKDIKGIFLRCRDRLLRVSHSLPGLAV